MSFDGIALRASVLELQDLVGSRIQKIYETPGGQNVILHLYQRTGARRLLISTDRRWARLQLTRRKLQHPESPSNFCMNLRKHLSSGAIASIEQAGLDRIAHLRITSRDDLGRTRHLKLIAETMGRFSNIILIDEDQGDRILTALRFSSPDRNPHRTVLAGHSYRPPPQKEGLSPLSARAEQLLALVPPAGEESSPAWLWLVQNVSGPGPDEARRILQAVGIAPGEKPAADPDLMARLAEELNRCGRIIADEKWAPYLIAAEDPDGPFSLPRAVSFGVIPRDDGLPPGTVRTFPAPSHLMDAFYALGEERERFDRLRKKLRRSLTSAGSSVERRMKNQRSDLRTARDAEKLRLFGELLTTYMHQVRRGMEEVTLPDYYDEGRPVTIPLDPGKSPADNASRYFNRYRKLRRAEEIGRKRLRATREELTYIMSLLDQVERAETTGELLEVQSEAARSGYGDTRGKRERGDRGGTASRPYRTFLTPSGARVHVGRNNRGNDHLVSRVASADDLWMHVKDIPGSHLILPGPWTDESPPPPGVLEESAILAAYHSAARQSSNVPVDYTLVRNVKKPRGAKPGMVTYRGQRTLYVTPPLKLTGYREITGRGD
ncbi:MAG: NFACT RNA binding domain-containing protein [Bacillota bacterium]